MCSYRSLAHALIALLAVDAVLMASGCGGRPPHPVQGLVVSLDGEPVAGATVTVPGDSAETGADGRFAVAAEGGPQWVAVEKEGFLARVRAAVPGRPVLVRLTPDDGATVALHFVGDAMLGRRFFDPNEDGDTSDGLIATDASSEEHRALLRRAEPLLRAAHLTVGNLETPLIEDPYFSPLLPRPDRFHPTKEFAYASHLNAAPALHAAGFDVLALSNNHLYDALEAGVLSTTGALQRAGFGAGTGYFGAGRTASEAWEPAVQRVRGQTIAFLGCTSITGVEHPVSYVAGPDKGGAAACNEGLIRASVARASRAYDYVVFMVHGGYEYERSPSGQVRRLTAAAREAGAILVVNHHPHVVGGLDWDGESLVAWTLGNFVFDQTVWPTFESYLLAVHLRNGRVVRAYVEPLMVEGYTPTGVVGELAEYVARGAAGRSPGPYVVEGGAVEVDVGGLAQAVMDRVLVEGPPDSGRVYPVPAGWRAVGFEGSGSVRYGRDLLWTGGFEPLAIGPTRSGPLLWAGGEEPLGLSAAAAYEGLLGLRLERRGNHGADAVAGPVHRVLTDPGAELTLLGRARVYGAHGLWRGAGPTSIQLSWYDSTRGSSFSRQLGRLRLGEREAWEPFRVDAQAPQGAVATMPYLRLPPPRGGAFTADFDDVRLVRWAPPGARPSAEHTHVLVRGRGTLLVARDQLPTPPPRHL